ncbi:stage II sporulation protein P [Peribacillus frigoritolerans]|uniref:stage II sporulation protein P n=1 Tax=Peribacillus frigoritolerans TaxID=450367 RepID=UPI003D27B8E9
MQNDNEIFEEIKRSMDLNPRTEFVNDTRHLLVKKANHTYKQNFYNHDLFANSLLLQIGGVENTIDEEDRSVELLAEIIDEILVELD